MLAMSHPLVTIMLSLGGAFAAVWGYQLGRPSGLAGTPLSTSTFHRHARS